MISSFAPTNRLSLISFLCAIFTLIFFCIGLAPIYLSAWVCYPSAILFGMAALATGFTALRQIRTSGEKGRGMALLAIWMGSLTILAVLCFTTLTILFIYYGAGYLYANWPQFKP